MTLGQRLAGAPISWGVCEVPGWGPTMPAERVLSEMSTLGLRATELGPTGYLGDGPAEVRALLERHGLRLVGGFVPVVLHDVALRGETERVAVDAARILAAAGAEVFVTAAVVDQAWAAPAPLGVAGWRALLDGLMLLDDICAAHGLVQALHPHVGTLVETADDVRRVLGDSGVRWCLDTGHLTVGGTDPVAFAARYADRVAHVHLKDVRLDLARSLRRHELSLLEATRRGLFRPLGHGDVAVGEVVAELERGGYRGWYVLEQDVAITDESVPMRDVLESVAFLGTLADHSPAGALPAER